MGEDKDRRGDRVDGVEDRDNHEGGGDSTDGSGKEEEEF